MTRTCAKDLTDRINSTSEDLAGMLKRAHDEKAWQALGYDDWKSYVAAEIKFSERHAFRLLDFANITAELADCPIGQSLPPPTRESVTRPLKDVPSEQRPAVYAAAVEAAGGQQPTAKQVEAAVIEITKPHVANNSGAMAYAEKAIRALEKIQHADPEKRRAYRHVRHWLSLRS